jgi:N-acetylmuramic acid 6-phosphate etherase
LLPGYNRNTMKAASRRLHRTEQRSMRSRGLDQRSTLGIVRAISRDDTTVARAVARELPRIARAADAAAHAFQSGGRLIYVGAGTSGRLATLDAAECPPTFGVSPTMVQAVIAGGRRALTAAVEGAEDDSLQGKKDLAAKKLAPRDVVVGLSVSGTTPYVLGALQFARRRGACTVAVTSNPRSPIARIALIAIVAETGPEVIAGSTRMKAGTAQKMILNMLSTAAMVRLGRVYNNWMIDVALSNKKLRQRGLHILQDAAGARPSQAARALRLAENDVRVALVMLKSGANASDARRRLRAAGGRLRSALGE